MVLLCNLHDDENIIPIWTHLYWFPLIKVSLFYISFTKILLTLHNPSLCRSCFLYLLYLSWTRKLMGLWHSWQHDNKSISADITYEVTFSYINHLISFEHSIGFLSSGTLIWYVMYLCYIENFLWEMKKVNYHFSWISDLEMSLLRPLAPLCDAHLLKNLGKCCYREKRNWVS